ncbi:hypothetical protein DLAC_11449 [Tieghemostelium lacteum]|uniref:FNIP repeat-containing protein n=1 Tax=Tieghemostelium lacteum TaxID=361077 RepID=A0A152A790_TIELA|nr:hypothetical protein DLAC_11449 [Tieghemostelium lacteum]|eukprot:KYR01995.1 hypothetical protein DLAC_11449 [Tieghemostelium lacteum]
MNYYVVCQIINYLENNNEILNLLYTCKINYKYRDNIRWLEFPTGYYLSYLKSKNNNDQDNSNKNTSKRDIISSILRKPKKLSTFNVLPSKFRNITIRTTEDLQVFIGIIDEFNSKFSINGTLTFCGKGAVNLLTLPGGELSGVKLTTYESWPEFPKDTESTITDITVDGISHSRNLIVGFPTNTKSLTLNRIHCDQLVMLPRNLETLKLGPAAWEPCNADDLPRTLKTLHAFTNFPSGHLPESITDLSLYHRLNYQLRIDEIPSNVKYLKLLNYNRIKPGHLPNSLVSLELDSEISPGVFPQHGCKLVSLTYLAYYSQPIHVNSLPHSLKFLKLSSQFNLPIETNVLPVGLETLIFGFNYNIPIGQGVLPPTLQSLTFDSSFNQILPIGLLPPSLTELVLGDNFNQTLDPGVIPSSVRTLTLGKNFQQPLSIGCIPSSVSKLTVTGNYKYLLTQEHIPSVKKLNYYSDKALFKDNIIPSSITKLTIIATTQHAQKLIEKNKSNPNLVISQWRL